MINPNATAAEIATARAARRLAGCADLTAADLLAADKRTRATLASLSAHPLVYDATDERDTGEGIWIYLKSGWIAPGTETATIHESNIRACLAELRRARFVGGET